MEPIDFATAVSNQKAGQDAETKEAQDQQLMLQSNQAIKETIANATKALVAVIKSNEPNVTVKNQPTFPTSISTPDVQKVVDAVEALAKITDDDQPLLDAIAAVQKELADLPAKIVIPENEKVESVSVDNQIDYTAKFDELGKAISKIDVKPEVKVDAPVVNTPITDLSPITEALASLQTAVENIKPPTIPKVDNSTVISAVKGVQDAINGLMFPTANFILPFKDPATGKATQVTLNADGSLPTASGGGGTTITGPLGQTTMSASLPVTLASDQPAITIGQNDLTATGAITTKNLNPNSGTATAGSTVAFPGAMVGISTVSIQTAGIWTGLLTPQVSLDGADWVNMNATSLVNVTSGAYSATIPSAAQQIYQADIAGFAYFRLTATPNDQTGTATVYLRATNATGLVGIDNPLPPGANALGSVSVSSGTITAVTTANTTLIKPVLVTGQTTSNTTQVQFTATSRPVTQGILIKSNAANATPCYVGVTGVSTTTGFELAPGQTITLYPTNANLLYVIGTTALDVISWVVQ